MPDYLIRRKTREYLDADGNPSADYINVAQYTADAPRKTYEIDPAYVGEEYDTTDVDSNVVVEAAADLVENETPPF